MDQISFLLARPNGLYSGVVPPFPSCRGSPSPAFGGTPSGFVRKAVIRRVFEHTTAVSLFFHWFFILGNLFRFSAQAPQCDRLRPRESAGNSAFDSIFPFCFASAADFFRGGLFLSPVGFSAWHRSWSPFHCWDRVPRTAVRDPIFALPPQFFWLLFLAKFFKLLPPSQVVFRRAS